MKDLDLPRGDNQGGSLSRLSEQDRRARFNAASRVRLSSEWGSYTPYRWIVANPTGPCEADLVELATELRETATPGELPSRRPGAPRLYTGIVLSHAFEILPPERQASLTNSPLEDARELPNILIDTQDGVLVFEGLAYFYGDGVVMVAEDLGRVFEEKLYRALTDEMGFEVFRRALNLTTTPPWLVEPPRKWGLLTSNRRSASN